MISDEPDEDADTFDDETLLATYAGADSSKRQAASGASGDVRDWPLPHGAPGTGVDIDAATLAWFKANHADWQAELRTVLRTWVAEQSQPPLA